MRLRAAEHGRSAEEEHREILRAALQPPAKRTLKQLLFEIPPEGEDEDFERPRDLGRDVIL